MHLEPEPVEGFILPPDKTEIDRAVATICGSNPIMELDDEGARDFESFVREVLTLGVGKKIERLRTTLESLTKDPPRTLAREPDTDCEVIIKMRAIARAALDGGDA